MLDKESRKALQKVVEHMRPHWQHIKDTEELSDQQRAIIDTRLQELETIYTEVNQ